MMMEKEGVLKTIKKENLRDRSYYFGAGHDTDLALWDNDTQLFHYVTPDFAVSSVKHIDDNLEKGFYPRCEVRSLYVLFRNFLSIVNNCSGPGWDKRDAKPVTFEVYKRLLSFLETLSMNTSLPMLGAKTDGSVTLEWVKKNERMSINVNHSDVGVCQINLKDIQDNKVLIISSEIPEEILEVVRKLH